MWKSRRSGASTAASSSAADIRRVFQRQAWNTPESRRDGATSMAVNGILGIKLGMAQVFGDDGTALGCTVLQAGPCVVVQRRTKEKDGYDAAQLGLVEFIKPQRVNK